METFQKRFKNQFKSVPQFFFPNNSEMLKKRQNINTNSCTADMQVTKKVYALHQVLHIFYSKEDWRLTLCKQKMELH